MSNEIRSYSVPGVSCEHCRTAITPEVLPLAGVDSVEVDLARKVVMVAGPGVSDASIRGAIEAAGYDVAQPVDWAQTA